MEEMPICRVCGVEMQLKKHTFLQLPDAEHPFNFGEQFYADFYVCPECRRMELFCPLSPIEEYEKMQKLQMNGVERFEYQFKDYTEKQLQKVIEGKNYVDEAKQAAKRLLAKRRSL